MKVSSTPRYAALALAAALTGLFGFAEPRSAQAEAATLNAVHQRSQVQAQALGDLSPIATVQQVHRRWRWRRGRVLRSRYYHRLRHGPRYRYRRGPNVYVYDGWYYNRPWWLTVDYRRYPRRAYVSRRYRVHYDGRCDYWADRCAANWGVRNPDFQGCLRYHGCR